MNDSNAQLAHAVILAYEESVLWHSKSAVAHEIHHQREGQLPLFIVPEEMDQLRERSAAVIRKSDQLNDRIDQYFDNYAR